VANHEELGEGNDELAFKVSLFILQSDSLYAVKSYDVGPTYLLPL
jgi:hypothetical protein